MRYKYAVVFTQEYIASEELYYSPQGRRAEVYKRTTDPPHQLSAIQFGSTLKVSQKDMAVLAGNTLWNTAVLGAFIRSNVLVPALQPVIEWFIEALQTPITPQTSLLGWTSQRVEERAGFKEKVVQLLKKADVQIEDLEIEVEEHDIDEERLSVLAMTVENELLKEAIETRKLKRKGIIFHHAVHTITGYKVCKLPSAYESQGTRRYYSLNGVLAELMATANILTIDELESSLHPDLVQHFLLEHLVHSTKSQLLVTTHNLFLLDNEDIVRRNAIGFTQKRDNGSTELFSLADFSSTTLRNDASIINHYKIGKLGAKPKLGSVFLQ